MRRVSPNLAMGRVLGNAARVAACLALTAVILLPHTALAAEESASLEVQDMKVSIWPEYDDPRVLVMYQGEFASDAKFPQKVRFLIPKGAEISQVCALTKEGEHLCQLYETEDVGNYTAIDYTLPMPTFFLEFYFDPGFSGVKKSIEYQLDQQYPIENLEVEAQQPLKASAFRTEPSPASMVTDSQGFKYSRFNYQNVEPNKPFDFKISYTKDDPTPSVRKQDSSGGQIAAPRSDVNPLLLAGMGILFSVGVAYWLFSRRRPALAPARASAAGRSHPAAQVGKGDKRGAASAKPRQNRMGAPRPVPSDKKSAVPRFCAQCGEPVGEASNFCAACGAEVRRG